MRLVPHFPAALAAALALTACSSPHPSEPPHPSPTAAVPTTPAEAVRPTPSPSPSPAPTPQPAAETTAPLVSAAASPLTVEQWLDEGTTVPPDFVPPVDATGLPAKADGESALVYVFDRKTRAGAPGVEIEPIGAELASGPFTTNAAGFAILALAKGTPPNATVRLRVRGNWLRAQPGRPLQIERAFRDDLVFEVPLGRKTGRDAIRIDVFPAVEVEFLLREGNHPYTLTPVTVKPAGALAAALAFTPDDSKANKPRIKVPARPGDRYVVSVPESYLGEARDLATITLDDLARKTVADIDMVTGEVKWGHETVDAF